MIKDKRFTGERALFNSKALKIENSIFEDGESPLKESTDIELEDCIFGWKYPLWYCKNITTKNCHWQEMARAGVWYTDNISVKDALIQAPKNFRRCNGILIENTSFTRAAETLWNCKNVSLKNVTAKGDYFAIGTENIEIDGFMLDGNYSFDGVKNMTIKNAKLLSKDAFWNSENVTVYDSFISGEYLGWNSKNLTLVNCTIESLQGMCYIENLVMKNCRLINTTLAFEYSSVDAEISNEITSVLNPGSGTITAASIGELIIEKDQVDSSKTKIICETIAKTKEHPDWRTCL